MNMERVVFFVVFYFCFCVIFFEVIQKPLFCFYNRKSNMERPSLGDWRRIYSHGFVTDLIVASYLTAVPLLLVWIHSHLPYFNLYWLLTSYNVFLSLAVALIVVADVALYKFWQFKIDSSVFTYLESLKGTFASVSIGYVLSALLVVLAVGNIFFCGVNWITDMYCHHQMFTASGVEDHLGIFAIVLVFVISLFVIIRGLKIRPNNPSIAYYSKNPFYNHSALNPLYNLIYSLTSVKNDFEGQFRFFKEEHRAEVFELLFPVIGTPQIKLLNTTRPNILLIVWESLCARYIESLGGMSGVTVNIDSLAKEGVLFTRCDAGSFRTDRGLVCLLSGYPGQPTTSVIKYTRKLPHLPAFPRVLRDLGYSTMALHGGDLTIMHKSDYYLASGHDKLVSQKDFPSSAPAGKWGINDGYTFSWLYDDIQQKTQQGIQWYTTFQTLSSHEPFDVPYHRLEDKMANSFAYVDDCFGSFVDRLKASPAWDNLLIICTGDHGFNLGQPLSRSEYPHIPLLLLGGALNQSMKIDTIISQTDLAATLLGQLEISHKDFMFSRDVLADTYTYPFSFHTYNNGFLFRDADGYTNYDNVADMAIEGADDHREEQGKAILQTLYEDLNRR